MWRAAAALHNQQLETVRSWPVEQCMHHRKFGIITLLCVCLNTWFSYFKLHVTIFKRNNKGFILNTQVPKHVCINCGFRSKMSWYILFCWDPFWCNFILEFIGHSVMLLCASYLLLTPSSPCSLAPHLLWQLQLYISSDPHALTHWLQRRTLATLNYISHACSTNCFGSEHLYVFLKAKQEHCFYTPLPRVPSCQGHASFCPCYVSHKPPSSPNRIKSYERSYDPESMPSSYVLLPHLRRQRPCRHWKRDVSQRSHVWLSHNRSVLVFLRSK